MNTSEGTDLTYYRCTEVFDEPGQVSCHGRHCGLSRGVCARDGLCSSRPATQTGPKIKMAEYDLTRTIIPYLDRHLVFPLLSHLHESGLFAPEQVAAAQYELAKGTNMVDYIVSLYEQLNPDSDVPQGEKRLRFLLFYIPSNVV